MKNKRKAVDELIILAREHSKNPDGSINYARLSGYLEGFITGAALVGFENAVKNFTANQKKCFDILPSVW